MNWLDSMGLKHKALPPLMTYPTVPKTLVSIYMATESTMVRVIWLTPYLLFSYVQLIATPWTASLQVSLSFTVSQSLLRLMCIESVMPANHLILCRPLFLLPSIFPSSRVFPMSRFFAWSGQSIGVSFLASALPMNIQDWLPLGWTGWISLQSKGLSRVLSNTTVQKHQFFSAQLSL